MYVSARVCVCVPNWHWVMCFIVIFCPWHYPIPQANTMVMMHGGKYSISLIVAFMFHFWVLIFFYFFASFTFPFWSNTNFRIDAINNTILILNSNCPTFQSHHSTQTNFKVIFQQYRANVLSACIQSND